MSSAAAESDCEDIAEAFAGKGLEDSMAERAPRVRQCQLEPLLYSAVGGYCAENANRRITLDISDWLHVRDLWRNSARPNTDTQFTLTRKSNADPRVALETQISVTYSAHSLQGHRRHFNKCPTLHDELDVRRRTWNPEEKGIH